MLRRALLSAFALAFAAPAQAQPNLTISVYGISQDAMRKHLYAPFEARCGCKLVIETGNSGERLAKLEARRNNPEIDIAVITDFHALEAARKGLLDPIDVTRLSNHAKLFTQAKDPIGGNMAVGYTLYATGIVYRSDKVRIGSWNDLWQSSLKDRIALPSINTSQAPMLLFMVDRAGGGTSADFAGGIERIAAAKGDIVTFYERGAQLVQLFQQDEVWAAVSGRFNWPLIRRLNLPLAWAQPSEGNSGGMNVIVLPKGSKQRDLALQLADFWLSTEVQTALALDLVDSPANTEVQVPANVADQITFGPADVERIRFVPPAAILDHRDGWLKVWNERVAR